MGLESCDTCSHACVEPLCTWMSTYGLLIMLGDIVHVGDCGMCVCMCTYMSVVNREPQHLPSSRQIIMLPASSAPEAGLPRVPVPTPTLISYLWVVPTPGIPCAPLHCPSLPTELPGNSANVPSSVYLPPTLPPLLPDSRPRLSPRPHHRALGVSLSSCVCPLHNLEVPRGQGLGNFWIPELWVQAWAQEAPRGS